jgi:hypothetical protein
MDRAQHKDKHTVWRRRRFEDANIIKWLRYYPNSGFYEHDEFYQIPRRDNSHQLLTGRDTSMKREKAIKLLDKGN